MPTSRKKQSSVSNRKHNHNALVFAIIALLLILGFLVIKYMGIKKTWYTHVVELQSGISKDESLSTIEDAKIIATTISTVPQGLPLVYQSSQLQKYISSLSNQLGRNIIIVDKNQMILADTIPANVSKKYTEDINGEVSKTMFDGVARAFLEKSTDYPQGISQEVVQMKDTSGTIIGAVILSSSSATK